MLDPSSPPSEVLPSSRPGPNVSVGSAGSEKELVFELCWKKLERKLSMKLP